MLKVLRVLQIGLALFLLMGVAAFVFRSVSALKTRGEIDYGEGIVMWQAANVTDWTKAYHPIENYPHVVFHYTPLFHLASRFINVFTRDLLVAGRLTSMLSLVGTCLVAALLTATVLPPGRDRFARILGPLAAGTLVFTTTIWWWACLMRVDALAIFLSVCGVALFVWARRRRALGFLALAFFVAAVYAKQTSLAAPAACLILAFVEKPRYALQLLAFSVSLGLAVLLMLHTATDGLFLRHIITYNQNPYYLNGLLNRLYGHAVPIMAPLFFSAVFPVALLFRRKNHGQRWYETLRLILTQSDFERCVVVVGLYLLFAAVVVTATISKLGAWENYWLEMDIAVCLLAGLFLGWLIRRHSFRPRRVYLLLQMVVLIVFIGHTFRNWGMLQHTVKLYSNPPVDYSLQVVDFLKTLPDPVYSEDMVVLMMAGKEVPAEPAIISALTINGTWDETPFVQRIQRGEFHAIIIRNTLEDRGRFTWAVVDAMRNSYYHSHNIGFFKIYLPK